MILAVAVSGTTSMCHQEGTIVLVRDKKMTKDGW